MKKSGLNFLLIVAVIVLLIAGVLMTTRDGQALGATSRAGSANMTAAANLPLSSTVSCQQIVVNPQLDVVELGPGKGTAEPWFFMDPIIYFFKEGDGSNNAYDGYSLVLPDGDDGDPTPNSDILSQVVQFGSNLQSVTIAYQRAMLDSNPADNVYGELWSLTEDGDVDLENPGQYRVTRWPVTDSEDAWNQETIELDAGLFAALNGQEIALLLRTETDGGGASAADEEWVLFDDITISACGNQAALFLPVVSSS